MRQSKREEGAERTRAIVRARPIRSTLHLAGVVSRAVYRTGLPNRKPGVAILNLHGEDASTISTMEEYRELTITALTSKYLLLSASSGEEIVRIHFDGRVTVNPKFTVDEAAGAFWDAVQKIATASRPM